MKIVQPLVQFGRKATPAEEARYRAAVDAQFPQLQGKEITFEVLELNEKAFPAKLTDFLRLAKHGWTTLCKTLSGKEWYLAMVGAFPSKWHLDHELLKRGNKPPQLPVRLPLRLSDTEEVVIFEARELTGMAP